MEYHQGASPSSNVLLSVDEILGLVIGEDDDHDDPDSDEDIHMASSPLPPVRSDSLGAVDSSNLSSFAFPPLVQRRAQSWHAMTGVKNAKDRHRSKRLQERSQNKEHLGPNSTDDDGSDEALFRNGSMPMKAPGSSSKGIPRDYHTQLQHNDRSDPPVPNRFLLPPGAYRYPSISDTNALYNKHPKLVESQIAPFERTHQNERKGVGQSEGVPFNHNVIHPPSTTAIKKKATSRFEIFEDKLREEEGTFGILL